MSTRTIKRLELNQHRLIKLRADLLVNLVEYEGELEKVLDEMNDAKNINKKNRLLGNIFDSLDKLEILKNPDNKFSGFCKYYIENSLIISSAKEKLK